MMQEARRADVHVGYNGKDITASLSSSLLAVSYTDNKPGLLDDLQITLQDREQLWQGDWSPEEGDKIDAYLKTVNWNGPNRFAKLPFGVFEVDGVDFSGPPDVVQIKATALPYGTGASRERRSRAWERATLKMLAADVARGSKLKLIYEAPDNPLYDRMEQNNQTDLGFLLDLCQKEGLALKVTSGKLVLFDEFKYEQATPVLGITRQDVISYSFGWTVVDAAYRSAQLVYKDSKKTISASYTPPGTPKSGPVLKLNESVSSEAEAIRICRKRLREVNKNYGRGSMSLPGDVRLAAGITITISGWQRFDGKYIIESAAHSVSSGGYATSIEIRKVLGW